MIRNYGLVFMEDAVPGMVLSDSLLDRHGKVLLAKKTVLDEKLLESLRRYDIDMIPVVNEALTPEEEVARIAADLARLDRLFRKGNYGDSEKNANDVLLACLKHYCRGGD